MIDDSDKEDFFEKIPEEKPKKEKPPKKPVYKPDDPRYYEEEESRWDHLVPAPYRRIKLIVGAAVVILLFCFVYWFCIYFFTPYIDNAETYGYVEDMQRKGTVFKTYEGTLIPYREIMDTTRYYDGDLEFSINDVHLAALLKRQERTGNPVRLHYVVYRHKMPWRGDSKMIVTSVDTVVDPSVLIPHDRRPEYPGRLRK